MNRRLGVVGLDFLIAISSSRARVAHAPLAGLEILDFLLARRQAHPRLLPIRPSPDEPAHAARLAAHDRGPDLRHLDPEQGLDGPGDLDLVGPDVSAEAVPPGRVVGDGRLLGDQGLLHDAVYVLHRPSTSVSFVNAGAETMIVSCPRRSTTLAPRTRTTVRRGLLRAASSRFVFVSSSRNRAR